MALLMSLTALSIDAILPALQQIQQELQVEPANRVQLLISILILGTGIGLMLFGPLSDQYGRKPMLLLGLVVFIGGCLLPHVWTSFEGLLVARLLQGIGAASARVITQAMVRDCFSGRTMARVMSLILTMFILVPVIAPWIGQQILNLFGDWQRLFDFMVVLALISGAWLLWGQAETLEPERRQVMRWRSYFSISKNLMAHPQVWGYTLMSGLLFGAFLGYLSSSAAIFQQMYGLGEDFPFYFGTLAAGFGVATILNSRMVMRYGMFRLLRIALLLLLLTSLLFALWQLVQPQVSLTLAMLYFGSVLFCFGLSFGNLNAIAMQPLGKEAGLGASLVGFFSTLFSVPIGALIGLQFSNSLMPITLGFLFSALLSLGLMQALPRPED